MKHIIFFRRSTITLTIVGAILIFGLGGSYAQEPIPPLEGLTLPDAANTSKIIVSKISFSGTGLITMYDPCTSQPVPKPEFDLFAKRNDPAAYSRAANRQITVKVKFRRLDPSVTHARVAARGTFGGFPFQRVTFSSDESGWVTFTSQETVPDAIQVHNVRWLWSAKISSAPRTRIDITRHRLYITNKAPLTSRVYRELVEWTTEWAQGLPDDGKQIADVILNGFAATGVIKYGSPGWDTAEILCSGDGMCGGMREVFYDACATQGVHVARSCYILKDADTGPEYKWNSMIIFAPGLGRTEPTFGAQKIREVDVVYPCPAYLGDTSSSDDVIVETRKAYEFFAPNDGHCINFLEYGGSLYLYDLSFGTGPWADTFTSLPYGDMSGTALYGFRMNYMNTAIDYMRGKIYYDAGGGCTSLTTNLDIKSEIIPYDTDEFKYSWSTNP